MHYFGLVLVAWGMSRAEADPLVVHASGPLPFTQAELEAALALRAAEASHRLEVDVAAEGAQVRIELAGRRRLVALDGARGGDAARLVAFAILDLAADRLVPPDAPPPVERIEPAPVPAARPAVAEASPRHTRAEAPPWGLAVWGTTGSREAVALEASLPLFRTVRAFASIGVEPETTEQLGFARRGFPVRAGAGWRHGWLELRAGATAVIERASAERAATELSLGGGAALVVVAPWTLGGLGLVIGAGGDAYARTIDYRVHGMPVAEGARFAWWAGVGVAREGRR